MLRHGFGDKERVTALLTDEELERYARHIVLREIGGPGQARIRAAKVLIIGTGGLGSPLALYLAAAGIGTLGLVDDDAVSLSNLQRQVLFRTADLGRKKVLAGEEAVKALNPGVEVRVHPFRVESANALALISGYDLVADGSDNFATRFLVNDACFFAQKTLVSAAVTEFEGQLATYKAYDGKSPCYRCLFAAPPPSGSVPSCSQTGVLGAAVGVMGALQALEVLKEITAIGSGMSGKLLVYKALSTEFRTLTLPKDPACRLCGKNPAITRLGLEA